MTDLKRQKSLLTCGILGALLYVAMTLLFGLLWEGYSSTSQAVSELSAIDAPTRPLWLVLGVVYSGLFIAFGWGVWTAAHGRRPLRIVGALLIADGVLGFTWPAMHQRAVLAAGGGTLTDTLHLVWTFATAIFMVSAIGVGAAAFGKRFRVYSIATIGALVLCGAVTGSYVSRIQANLPTPWFGVWERIQIGVFMLWVALLAFGLLRGRVTATRADPRLASSPIAADTVIRPGFEGVRGAFSENFATRRELGGACCAYVHGECVVDLWGGVRNEQTGEPWERNTMVVVHSATKGLAAMTLAVAHSRGWLDYEERVATYWPEFAQQGKECITVRQLLAHQAGLFAIDEPVDRAVVADLDRLAAVLAHQRPAWEPGTRQAYHGLTLGFYEGELLRRVDPKHRSLGQFFQDEIASPLGLDLYLRLPEEIPNSRLAILSPPHPLRMLTGFPIRFMLEVMNRRSNINRALGVNPGTSVYLDSRRIYARNLEVPSGNAVGTARAIARAYGAFATGGRELGLRKETLDLLAAPAIPATHGFFDECLKGQVQFSLGFMKPCANWPFGGPGSFGSPGSGGSLGFADPIAGVGYAYVTSQMGATLTGDPRDVALRHALYSAIAASSGASPMAA
jgi:CubicO group peptidase (beta-lactamase class C family)